MTASDATAGSGAVAPIIEARKPRGLMPGAIIALALCGSAAVLYLFNPAQSGFYPICIFHSTTGLLCPGCGSLRAMHQLLHGHVLTALRYNLLLVCSAPFVAAFSVRYAYGKLRGKPVALTIQPQWIYAGAILLILFAVLRNLPAFSLLRP